MKQTSQADAKVLVPTKIFFSTFSWLCAMTFRVWILDYAIKKRTMFQARYGW